MYKKPLIGTYVCTNNLLLVHTYVWITACWYICKYKQPLPKKTCSEIFIIFSNYKSKYRSISTLIFKESFYSISFFFRRIKDIGTLSSAYDERKVILNFFVLFSCMQRHSSYWWFRPNRNIWILSFLLKTSRMWLDYPSEWSMIIHHRMESHSYLYFKGNHLI